MDSEWVTDWKSDEDEDDDDSSMDQSESSAGQYERPVFQRENKPVYLNITTHTDDSQGQKDQQDSPAPKKKSRGNDPTAMAVLRKLTPELQHGYRILLDLMSDRCKTFAWPFMDRVDPVLLKLPDYEERITTPMWLTRIEEKFENFEYTSITEFVNDVRQILINCYRYNGLKHAVSRQGQMLECHFEQKLCQLPRHVRDKTYYQTTSLGQQEEEEDISGVSGRRRFSQRIQDKGNNTPVAEAMTKILEKEEEERHKMALQRRREELQRLNIQLANWERDELLVEPIRSQLRSMWEIASIGQFLKLCAEAMFLPEFSVFELERALVLPQSSLLLARVFTNVLTTRYHRKRVSKHPPMPYEFWQEKLRKKFDTWFSYLSVEGATSQSVARSLYIPETFFKVLGNVNPLTGRQYHDLSLYERVWVLKGLIDHLFETDYDVWFGIDSSVIEDQRPVVLGEDEERFTYLYFPHFQSTDLRIYRQAQIKEVKEDKRKKAAAKEQTPQASPSKKGKKGKAETSSDDASSSAVVTPQRGRGRPKKAAVESEEESTAPLSSNKTETPSQDTKDVDGDAKRGRGRPRKAGNDTPLQKGRQRKEPQETKKPAKPTAIVTPVRRSSRRSTRTAMAEEAEEAEKEPQPEQREDNDAGSEGKLVAMDCQEGGEGEEKLVSNSCQGHSGSDALGVAKESGPSTVDGVDDAGSSISETSKSTLNSTRNSMDSLCEDTKLNSMDTGAKSGERTIAICESGGNSPPGDSDVAGKLPDDVIRTNAMGKTLPQHSLCNGVMCDTESKPDLKQITHSEENDKSEQSPKASDIKTECSVNGLNEPAENEVLGDMDGKIAHDGNIKNALNQNQSNNKMVPGVEVVNSSQVAYALNGQGGFSGEEVKDSLSDLHKETLKGGGDKSAITTLGQEDGVTIKDSDALKNSEGASLITDAGKTLESKNKVGDEIKGDNITKNTTVDNKDIASEESKDCSAMEDADGAGKGADGVNPVPAQAEVESNPSGKLNADADVLEKPLGDSNAKTVVEDENKAAVADVKTEAGLGDDVEMVVRPPTPPPQPTPGLLPPLGEFELVCDSVAEFRELIERFAEKEETVTQGRKKVVQVIKRPMRVVYLHRQLTEMLEELEQSESKLIKVVHKAREKLHKEMVAYQKDPSPNQDAAEFWYQIPKKVEAVSSSVEVSSVEDEASSEDSGSDEREEDDDDSTMDEEEEEDEESDFLEEEEIPMSVDRAASVEGSEPTEGPSKVGKLGEPVTEEGKGEEKLDLYTGVEIAGRTMRSSKRRRAQKRDIVRAEKRAKRSKIQIVKGAPLPVKYSQMEKDMEEEDVEVEEDDDTKLRRVHEELKANLNAKAVCRKPSPLSKSSISTVSGSEAKRKDAPELNRDGRFIRLLKHTTGSGKPGSASQIPKSKILEPWETSSQKSSEQGSTGPPNASYVQKPKRAGPQEPTLRVPFLQKSKEAHTPEKHKEKKTKKADTFSFTIDASVWESLKDRPEERQRLIMEQVQQKRAQLEAKKDTLKQQNSRSSPWFSRNHQSNQQAVSRPNPSMAPAQSAVSLGQFAALSNPVNSSRQPGTVTNRNQSQGQPAKSNKHPPTISVLSQNQGGVQQGFQDMPALAPIGAQRAAGTLSANMPKLSMMQETGLQDQVVGRTAAVQQVQAPLTQYQPTANATIRVASQSTGGTVPAGTIPKVTVVNRLAPGNVSLVQASGVQTSGIVNRMAPGNVSMVQTPVVQTSGVASSSSTIILPTNLKVQAHNKEWKIVYVQKPGATKPELCLQAFGTDGVNSQQLIPLTTVQQSQQIQKQPATTVGTGSAVHVQMVPEAPRLQKQTVQTSADGNIQIQMVPQAGNKMVMQAVSKTPNVQQAPQVVVQRTVGAGQVIGATGLAPPVVQVGGAAMSNLAQGFGSSAVQVVPAVKPVDTHHQATSASVPGTHMVVDQSLHSISPTVVQSQMVNGQIIQRQIVQGSVGQSQIVQGNVAQSQMVQTGTVTGQSSPPMNNLIMQAAASSGLVAQVPEPSMKQVPVQQHQ